ncbi:MAG: peptidylprolyl isomerase [Treponema sp.]|jgi:parvulin-like peptidyl-prolyl isomerase|nr:peptidylprolyl isomerase [Treponema sp.]
MKRIFLVFLGLLTAVSGFSQSGLQSAATINLIRTEVITVGQLRAEVERMEKASGRILSQAERLQILDVMINERLVLQAAERDRVSISENEVNQQIQQLRSTMAQQIGRQPTDAEFNQAVRNESGLEYTVFREQLRRQLIVQKYLMFKKETLINSVKVPTEDEIRAQFNLLRAQFVRPDTVRFTMILVPYGTDAASRSRAKTLADSLVREIGSNPSKFDEVVARSHAPNSGYQAGDFGYLPHNMDAANIVGQEFLTVAFSLKQSEVSRLIEGIQGYHIIKITENHAMKNLDLNDIFQLGARGTVRDYIGQSLLNQRQQAIIEQASQELIAEVKLPRSFQIFENNVKW